MINGRAFDWESIAVDMPFGLDFEIQAINYNSENTVKPVYGRGRTARGYGIENLVQEGSLTINPQAWQLLLIYAGTLGGLFNIAPFPISVRFANNDQIPQIDYLPSVKFQRTETEANQGDTEIGLRTLGLVILDPIQYNLIPVA